MRKRVRKAAALLLSLLMTLGLMPGMAFAAEGSAPEESGTTPGGVAQIGYPDSVSHEIVYGETLYQTLDKAVEAANDGAYIKLLADCTTEGFNLSKNLTITSDATYNANPDESTDSNVKDDRPFITFKEHGIALHGTSLAFQNCRVVMNDIGSTPYTEWNWMSVCASKDASLSLDHTEFSMDAGNTTSKHAIYFCSNNKLNIVNGSRLEIRNYDEDALEWDGGDGGYNINITDSAFISDHNRSGFTGTFYATIDNSAVDVINSTGNGSNGSHFIIRNGSQVHFNDNVSHGLSAGSLSVEQSTVAAIRNGANGIHVSGALRISEDSDVSAKNNRCSISSQWTIPGALYIAGESYVSDSTVTITGNSGSGIYQKSGNLTIEESAAVTVTNNKAEKLGKGGGIYINGTATLPDNIRLYNNHAEEAGDDIYVSEVGIISFGPVGTPDNKTDETTGETTYEWWLDDCDHPITGWFYDGSIPKTEASVNDPEQDASADNAGSSEAPAGDQPKRWNTHSEQKNDDGHYTERYALEYIVTAAETAPADREEPSASDSKEETEEKAGPSPDQDLGVVQAASYVPAEMPKYKTVKGELALKAAHGYPCTVYANYYVKNTKTGETTLENTEQPVELAVNYSGSDGHVLIWDTFSATENGHNLYKVPFKNWSSYNEKTYTLKTFSVNGDSEPSDAGSNQENISIKLSSENDNTVTLNYYRDYTPSSGGSSSGGGGGSTIIEKPDVPLADLNKTDHFAYIIGYPDGTVKPAGNITRAEVATIFFRLLTDESRNRIWSTENSYSDVSAENWYNNAVSTLSNDSIIKGYTDGTFGGNRKITRAEFAAIASRFEADTPVENTSVFSDVKGHWAEKDIARAAVLGYVEGYTDGTFRPDIYITRAEAMTLVNRVLGRDAITAENMMEGMIQWPDNPKIAWFYAAVQEATNSHDYTMPNPFTEKWTEILEVRDWAAFEKAWSDANSAKNPGEVVQN